MGGEISPFWWRWLMGAAVVVLAVGLALMLLPDVMLWFFNLLLFSSDKNSVFYADHAGGYISFAHAVLGAVMIGWAVVLLYLAGGPFRRGERGAWSAIAISIIAWFVPDTGSSLHGGYYGNAVVNVAFFLLFVIPLMATYTAFHGERTDVSNDAAQASV